jgi:hypothetical protein
MLDIFYVVCAIVYNKGGIIRETISTNNYKDFSNLRMGS